MKDCNLTEAMFIAQQHTELVTHSVSAISVMIVIVALIYFDWKKQQ